MIDALVEFVLYPFRVPAAVQQEICFPLQIGKIEQTTFGFELLEFFKQCLPAHKPGAGYPECPLTLIGCLRRKQIA